MSDETKIRVLLSDNYDMSALVYQRMLEKAPGIECIGYSIAHDTTRLMIQQQQPDVVAIDLIQPGIAAFIPQLQQDFPALRLLVLTAYRASSIIKNYPWLNTDTLLLLEVPITYPCLRAAIRAAHSKQTGFFDCDAAPGEP